jgi:A/G-specific adenine glycosylase
MPSLPLSHALIHWFAAHKRDLPWRHTRDPYLIWMSEIILQQTRVMQGLPYYFKFIDAFPSVETLAQASETEVLKLWQGLGYYSRARNMHQTAKTIVEKHGGAFPKTALSLQKLKGIGPYTAAAIASFAFKEHIPVMDGNVMRVASRILGMQIPVDSKEGGTAIRQFLAEIIPSDHPDIFNQAIMEFGALHCKPRNPDCLICVLKTHCRANSLGIADAIPVKKPAKQVSVRFFQYVFLRDKSGNSLYRKRPEGDIWAGLYEPVLYESDQKLTPDEVALKLKSELHGNFLLSTVVAGKKHKLTHRMIAAEAYFAETDSLPQMQGYDRVDVARIDRLPVSRLVDLLRQKTPIQ